MASKYLRAKLSIMSPISKEVERIQQISNKKIGNRLSQGKVLASMVRNM